MTLNPIIPPMDTEALNDALVPLGFEVRDIDGDEWWINGRVSVWYDKNPQGATMYCAGVDMDTDEPKVFDAYYVDDLEWLVQALLEVTE